MTATSLQSAVANLPPGRWAVGVSGGADSVALLALLRRHRSSDIKPHVVHLDHQTRGQQSADDAEFVRKLSERWGLPCTLATRQQIEQHLTVHPNNPSALYRALRSELFRTVVQQQDLLGVILAHHADDQAETIFQRLLRGSGYAGLSGISEQSNLDGLPIRRPLLGVSRHALRAYLIEQSISWREDASNESDRYQRNRVRKILSDHPTLADQLRTMGNACNDLREWTKFNAPNLPAEVPIGLLASAPQILAEESAKRWLVDHGGVPKEELIPAVMDRLLMMSRDAALPAKQDFPGNVTVRRRRGMLTIEQKTCS